MSKFIFCVISKTLGWWHLRESTLFVAILLPVLINLKNNANMKRLYHDGLSSDYFAFRVCIKSGLGTFFAELTRFSWRKR